MRKSLAALIGFVAFVSVGVGTASAEVLVDQNDPPFADVRSDEYVIPPTSPTMNIRAADDFDVPAGETWTLNEVGVFGSFELLNEAPPGTPPPPPPSELFVTIFANEVVLVGSPPEFPQDFPGEVIYGSEAPLPATGGPNYTISLPNVPALSPGKYWISVQQADALYFNNDFQFTQQWFWDVIPFDFSSDSTLIETDGAVVPGCEPDPGTTWIFWTCDDEQQGGVLAASTPTARGGPPPVDSRMLISGTRGSPPGTSSPGAGSGAPDVTPRKRCKKGRVLRRGKCVKKKRKAKRVDPDFTG